jgi:tRNA-specific 2-thiouridylase
MKRVVVAMSGGVDSSVCAGLLKDEGFEVIGITMQIWQRSQDWGGCCGAATIGDAQKVAYKLGIRHFVLNFRDVFREKVITNFCQEYQEGRTPNPCIRCNQYLKFDTLFKKAKQLGADYIATGHYARIEYNKETNRYLLKKGVDAQKDQSYVLYMMTQEQLSYTLMPLGNFTKDKIRKIAKEKDLPVADKAESQEICFIPDNDYGKFIQKNAYGQSTPGPIINKEGETVGKHRGIIFYTIGQRKGIGIADKRPLYVASIDREHNAIVVGNKEDVYGDELVADNVSFVYMEELKSPIKAMAKIRYLHSAAQARVSTLDNDRIKVKFATPQWAITPGQAVVFYDDDIVIGGGTIVANGKYKLNRENSTT